MGGLWGAWSCVSPTPRAVNLDRRCPEVVDTFRPEGAPGIDGDPYLVDPVKVKECGGEFISETQLRAAVDANVEADPARWSDRSKMWKAANEREVLFGPKIPGAAVETSFMRYARHGGKGMLFLGVALTTDDMLGAWAESERQGSYAPLGRETLRQAGSWGAGFLGAWLGFKAGFAGGAAIGAPAGPVAVVTGLAGGVIFAIGGYFAGDAVADKVYGQ